MGQAERKAEATRDSKTAAKRGKGRARRGAAADGFHLTFEHWIMLDALAAALMTEGGAMRVGATRDGGALAVGVYHGDDYGTEYIRPDEDFNDAMFDIAEAWLKAGGSVYAEQLDKLGDGLRSWLASRGTG